MTSAPPLLVFDGACSFCSYWVGFVLRWESSADFQFAASQSQAAQARLTPSERLLTQSTLIVLEGERRYLRSDAVLYVLKGLKFFWPLGYLGRAIPRAFRDWLYDRVAVNRRRLPAPELCPYPENRSRFLA